MLDDPETIADTIAQLPAQNRSDAGRLTTDVLSSSAQIGALRDEWGALLADCPTAGPFQTWEWMMSWYETYEDEGAVRCLAVRGTGGRLVGIAPLFLGEHRDADLGRREIGFASTYGKAWGDYLQLIHRPGTGAAVAQATTEYLASIRDEWQCAKFRMMPLKVESAWPLISSMVAAGWHVKDGYVQRVAVAVLPSEGQDVVSAFSCPKLRTQCRKAARRLEESHLQHAFRFGAPENDLEKHLEHHMQLNVQRRSHLGRWSRFEDAKCRLWFSRATKRFAEAGRLRLSSLEIEGEMAATQVWLRFGETLDRKSVV
jgi:CelD/BcsL family acetyltransferase involved in cellulose biosynthesis